MIPAALLRRLVRALADAAGFRGRIAETGTGGSARSARVSWQCSDITAARDTLGWTPAHPLTASVTALWEATHRTEEARAR